MGQSSTVYIPYREGNKWAIANSAGEVLFSPGFREIFPAHTALIRFRKGKKYGYINPYGEVVIKPIYKKAGDFTYYGNELKAPVTRRKSSYYIDIDGEKADVQMGCATYSNMDSGYRPFKMDGKVGLLGIHGDTIFQPLFKNIKDYHNGPLVIAENFDLKFGILRPPSDTIYSFDLDSVNYDFAYTPWHYYRIYNEGMVGVVDLYGKIQAKPKYDKLELYGRGILTCFMAHRNGKKIGYVYQGKEFWQN